MKRFQVIHSSIRGILTVALLAAMVTAPAHAGKYNKVISIADPMPDFRDLPATDGNTYSSVDFDAAVVVLVSLANHCPWVQGMDPALVSLAEAFRDADVDIVGFSVNHREDDRLPAMKAHARENAYAFTYVYDESQALGRALGATRTPEYFVFNRERKLIYSGLITNSPARKTWRGKIKHINGEPKEFYVDAAIRAGLAGTMPAVTETRAHGCSVKYES